MNKNREAAGIFITDGKRCLLLKRHSPSPSLQTWSIPGGKLEKDETFWDGAFRETNEEIGCCPLGRIVGKINDDNGKKVFVTFVMIVSSRFNCKLSKEHTDWGWFSYDHLDSMKIHPRLAKKIPELIKTAKKSIS